jgi:hypothetical protein
MSVIRANTFQDANGGNTATINAMTPTADSLQGFRNRIINGDMRIDQRNAGASVNNTAASALYTIDRWWIYGTLATKFSCQRNAGSVTPPTGFTNYLGITSSAATTPAASDIYAFSHKVEGFNVSDFDWGTASAKTATLSFWVRSSLTGTFGGSLANSAADRNYVFSFTINAANTWEYKTVAILGDTSGTWLSNNGVGIQFYWDLGSGSSQKGTAGSWGSSFYYGPTGGTNVIATNNATFYITGVQLEKGSTATSFDYRPYGTELALCQRYYYKVSDNLYLTVGGWASSTTNLVTALPFPVSMRIAPTALEQSGTASHYRVVGAGAASTTCSGVPAYNSNTSNFIGVQNFPVSSGLTAYSSGFGSGNNASAYLGWSAEL